MIDYLLKLGIVEPMTMITDFLITIVASYCYFHLKKNKASKYWRQAFIYLGLSALAGGAHHGFANLWSAELSFYSWKLTLLSIGGVSLNLAFEAIYRLKTKYSGVLRTLFTIKTFVYFGVILFFADQFLVVITEYLPNLIFLLFMSIYLFTKERMQTHFYIILGVVISLIAAGIQMSGFAIHEHFNHNDLYHVVQIIGLIFYYKSALRYGAK